jgi:hypothetical protein
MVLDRPLTLGRSHLSAEVLLRDDVGGVLRPALGELDSALLEYRILRIAQHGIAQLPLHLLERMHSFGEVSLDQQARIRVLRL